MSDTQMIEERLRAFLERPDDADWQDVLLRAGDTRKQRRLLTRRRTAVVLAAGIAVAAPAVAFSGVLSSSSAPQSSPPNPVLTTRPPAVRTPLGFSPIALQLTRSGQRVTSIDVTVNAPTREATMLLQVLRGSPYGPDSNRTVVFQEQVPMTSIVSPANGPSGTVALSTWSGTLTPSDWDGGCQNALYTVKAVAGIQTTEAAWFRCSGE